ncbi:MAG: Excinuclease ABC C subunit domain protein [Candidatus Curtissbacteria bacterium GW2011_GWA1_41_11]|uniref:Excinuclease ABC C subunit domain protein n=1 Tax=Candidatus Curtissbacteria bacterium GW2011_GWA1_41_11 TaxID=1618409 RepID=A0A0G0UF13_9BACT|nr:MAG: Excinuclease ABC C subunit domain protein [Candidatus Curtissbacteria bacterium GW2011_GWA1_41_11]
MDLKKEIAKLPTSCGVYIFLDDDGKIIYVGKSVSIKKRVSSYFTNKLLVSKTNLLVKKITDIQYIKVESEFEALLLETELIRKNQPFFNFQAKDDKSPLYIKITNEKIPLVSLVRKPQISKGDFTKGPFPSTRVARSLLKTVRRIFPYCHHKNPKKPCLYVHLGLCSFPYTSLKNTNHYLKNIKTIKKLLSGKSKVLLISLIADMQKFANLQKFEEAQNVKKTIDKIKYILSEFRDPLEFLAQPTLVDDFAIARFKSLKNVLGLAKIPRRIECYDISNTAGKEAAGSMAVFENGQSQTNQYRKFRIKFKNTPDDYKMIKEVLSRRFKNNWPKPDLIVIDGGKGQLNAALSVLKKNGIDITVIAIAKKIDEIYCVGKSLPLRLQKENPARQLIQATRDEAHRFALTYHRLLRSKKLYEKLA